MFYITEFIYNSQRLEGSGLSLQLTQELLRDIDEFLNQIKEPMEYDKKLALDVLEAKNHYLEFVRQLEIKGAPMNSTRLCEIHRGVFGLTDENAGQIRDSDNPEYETEMIYPAYKFLPYLVEGYDMWLSQTKLKSLDLAAEIHRRITEIHPFIEGNGRLARLAMNLVLHEAGLDMFDIKFKDAREYINAILGGASVEWIKSKYNESVIVV